MGDGMKRAFAATRATRQDTGPKLGEIADRITAHLQRFAADPKLRETQNISGPRVTRFSAPSAKPGGGRIRLRFVDTGLTAGVCVFKGQAIQYLAWLDAGNVGTLDDWRRAVKGAR